MNNDLRDIDELFRSSLEFHEETPSPAARKKLEASLDKTDAESYKKRLVLWKRTAIVLFFLLMGLTLFEAGILNTGHGRSSKNNAGERMNPTGPERKNEKNGISLIDKKIDEPAYVSEKDKLNENAAEFKVNAGPQKHGEKKPADHGIHNVGVESSPESHDSAYISQNGIPQIIQVEKIYAFTLLKKSNPPVSIDRRANYPKIDNDSFLKNINPLVNKNRIGFKPHWLLGAVFSYEAAGYKLDSDLPNEISNIKHREVHEPSYSGGVLITRQVTIDWGLQSGFLYSKTAIGIGPQKIYAFLDPAGDVAYKYVTSSGYAYIKPKAGAPPSFGDSVLATEGKHSFSYFTVPLSVKYRLGKNKFSLVPGLGVEANFITDTRVETEIETPSHSEVVFFNKLYGAKSFCWSLTADAELRYSLNRKTMLSFRPSFHHSISPITENNIVETFPYSFRWGVGLTIKL